MIKWEGYSSADNTWEPEKHIDPGLIKLFENKRKERRSASKFYSKLTLSNSLLLIDYQLYIT